MIVDHEHSIWSGFYKKAIKERQQQLRLVFPHLFASDKCYVQEESVNGDRVVDGFKSEVRGDFESNGLASVDGSEASNSESVQSDGWPIRSLDVDIANSMIENCVGVLGLPMGLALNFVIDGTPLVIPMVVEEPSIVAAVSGVAKTLQQFGDGQGFTTSCADRNMIIAQIQFPKVLDDSVDVIVQKLDLHKKDLLRFANSFILSMVARGGGCLDLEFRKIARSRPLPGRSHWLILHIHIDVCDAMGANCAATVAEGLAPYIASLLNIQPGLRIVSNLSTSRISTAKFAMPTAQMTYKSVPGLEVARRIIEAYEWAEDDIYRAATHNKGIMNGIDAVAIATGQDWRAIESGSHAWCSYKNRAGKGQDQGHYGSLTKFYLEERDGDEWFVGELTLPLCVGTKGGVLNTNPVYSLVLGMMGNPDSKRLATILCSVGLAQNFAALRALVTEGIQRGHMSLHARNIAISAGAPPHAINECVTYMSKASRINVTAAREYLDAHELHAKIGLFIRDSSHSKPPSTFFFEEGLGRPTTTTTPPTGVNCQAEDRVTLNIAFQTTGSDPVHFEFTADADTQPRTDISRILFGSQTWAGIIEQCGSFDELLFVDLDNSRPNQLLIRKLKYLSALLGAIVQNLMKNYGSETRQVLERVLGGSGGSGGGRSRSKSGGNFGGVSSVNSRRFFDKGSNGRSLLEHHIQSIVQSRRGVAGSTGSGYARSLSPDRFGKSPLGFESSFGGGIGSSGPTGVSRGSLFQFLDVSSLTAGYSEPLRVGLSLIVSLWQVFELRVSQWVGNVRLANLLRDEQRRVVSALLINPSELCHLLYSGRGGEEFQGDQDDGVYEDDYLAIQGKQHLFSMFLLCNAVCALPSFLTEERIAFVLRLGGFLEREHARNLNDVDGTNSIGIERALAAEKGMGVEVSEREMEMERLKEAVERGLFEGQVVEHAIRICANFSLLHPEALS